ncbi:MAG: hypothetical protein DRH37_06940 [Deltaproteobacteria bacterium]|nr:MAG: hypothetical protein DRH37_06940 [Deltaproteobacteria bacterium]
MSGIKYVFRTVACNCTVTGVWLGKEADESTKVPPALIKKTLKRLSKKHLDTVQITYDSRDEINLLGNGTIRGTDWQKRLSYLMPKESVTFLSGKGNLNVHAVKKGVRAGEL